MIVDGSIVVDVDPSLCEDGMTWLFWYKLDDGRTAVQSYELGGRVFPALIIEGVSD